jgi:hypothetical protein
MTKAANRLNTAPTWEARIARVKKENLKFGTWLQQILVW